ncbi:MAG: PIN domain-containing protein [Gemmatimonadota bacterium]
MKRLLTDAGPLVALLDADDASHGRCVEVLKREHAVLVTTWAAITEALYLLTGSLTAQDTLLDMIEAGDLHILEVVDLVPRIRALMAKYHDLPMDFADSSLVAVAEREGLDTVFTLDADFRIYRWSGRRHFRLLP